MILFMIIRFMKFFYLLWQAIRIRITQTNRELKELNMLETFIPFLWNYRNMNKFLFHEDDRFWIIDIMSISVFPTQLILLTYTK